MKKLLTVITAALLIGGTSAWAADAASLNIAVVNVQQLFQQSPRIAELNKKLQSQFKPRQDKLAAAQKDLQAEVDQYKKDSATMSQKDKDALQKKIESDQANLSKDANTFQQDLSKEQNKIMKGVLSELNGIIASIAKKNSYSMVLDSQAVIYSTETSDITKQVSSEFDKK